MKTSDAQKVIAEIEKLNPKLNDYEKGFIESIRNNSWITNKQSMVLMQIYGKAAGGGVYQRRQYINK